MKISESAPSDMQSGSSENIVKNSVKGRFFFILTKPHQSFVLSSKNYVIANTGLVQAWLKKWMHSTLQECQTADLLKAEILDRLVHGQSLCYAQADECINTIQKEATRRHLQIDRRALKEYFALTLALLGEEQVASNEWQTEQQEPLA